MSLMTAALGNVKVLDFSQAVAGPFCTMLLGDMGADVVKVEPKEGDTTRGMMTGDRGHPEWCEDPRFRTPSDRVVHQRELTAIIEAVTTQHSRAYWLERCEQAGIPAGPILDYSEVFADPHVQERRMIWEYAHPEIGTVRSVGNPVKMSATPADLHLPPPALGEHTREVLASAGYTATEIDALLACGAAG